jgi:hypothetical protein
MAYSGNQQLYNDLTSVTYQHILPTIQDVYFKVSTIFPFLFRPGNFKTFSGYQIQVPIQYAPLKGGPTVDGGTFDISYAETESAMIFVPKEYYTSVTLSRQRIALEPGRGCRDVLRPDQDDEPVSVDDAVSCSGYLQGRSGHGQSGVNALDGLLAANDDGTHYRAVRRSGSRGNRNRPERRHQRLLPSLNAPISVQLLQFAIGSASFGNVQPNLAFTTQPIWDTLWLRMFPRSASWMKIPARCRFGFASLKFYGNKRVMVDQYIADRIGLRRPRRIP